MNLAFKFHDTTANHTYQNHTYLNNTHQTEKVGPFNLNDYLELMGWATLPLGLKESIEPSLDLYHSSLTRPYEVTPQQLKHWRAVFYWVECYRSGICTQQTALEGILTSA